jgi:hypothetical protein
MKHEELRNFKTLPDIRIVRAQRMRWTRQVALVEEKKYGYIVFEGKMHMVALVIDGRIILKRSPTICDG